MYQYIKSKLNLQTIVLSLILLLGFSLRVYKLDQIPAGFFTDEAANGYIAYSLLTTGKDDHAQSWPFFFQSFGDYRTPVYIYSTIPSIALFGLNEFATRLPSVIYGTLTILAIYFLAKQLFNKFHIPLLTSHFSHPTSHIPLLTSLLLAVSPWHIHFSRTAFEFIPFPFFFTLATYFFVKSIAANSPNSPNTLNSLISAILFSVSLYTYYPSFLQTPFLILVLLIIFHRFFFTHKKQLAIFLFTFSIASLPFIYGFYSGKLLTRFQSVSRFKAEPTINLKKLAPGYLAHFKADFLFSKGDVDLPGHFITRHSLHGTGGFNNLAQLLGFGQLYAWQAPFILLGVIFLLFSLVAHFCFRVFSREIWRNFAFTNIQYQISIIIPWLLLYPLGSLVTADPPFAHRSIIGVVPFQILTSLGLTMTLAMVISALSRLYTLFSHTLFSPILTKIRICEILSITYSISLITLIALITLIFLSTLNFSRLYFHDYPKYSSDYWGWQYGPKDIIKYFLEHQAEYDELIMSGEFNAPEIFLKFYDPANLCQNKCRLGSLKNLDPAKRQLFALKPHQIDIPLNQLEVIHRLYYPNQEPAFLFFTPLPPLPHPISNHLTI